jgi:hypothetical protein
MKELKKDWLTVDDVYNKQQQFDLAIKYNYLGYRGIEYINWGFNSQLYNINNSKFFNDPEFVKEFCLYIHPLALFNSITVSEECIRILAENENLHSPKPSIIVSAVQSQDLSEQFLEDYFDIIAKYMDFYDLFRYQSCNPDFILRHGICLNDKKMISFEFTDGRVTYERDDVFLSSSSVLKDNISGDLNIDGEIYTIYGEKRSKIRDITKGYVTTPVMLCFAKTKTRYVILYSYLNELYYTIERCLHA